MARAPAFAGAVSRARRTPQLAVGLHLVLADGWPVLPPDQVRELIGADGRFRPNMTALAFDTLTASGATLGAFGDFKGEAGPAHAAAAE